MDFAAVIATAQGLRKALAAVNKAEYALQVVEITDAIQEARAENTALKDRIKTLEDNSALESRLTFHGDAYWLDAGSPERKGPFCLGCWSSKRILSPLVMHALKRQCSTCTVCDAMTHARRTY